MSAQPLQTMLKELGQYSMRIQRILSVFLIFGVWLTFGDSACLIMSWYRRGNRLSEAEKAWLHYIQPFHSMVSFDSKSRLPVHYLTLMTILLIPFELLLARRNSTYRYWRAMGRLLIPLHFRWRRILDIGVGDVRYYSRRMAEAGKRDAYSYGRYSIFGTPVGVIFGKAYIRYSLTIHDTSWRYSAMGRPFIVFDDPVNLPAILRYDDDSRRCGGRASTFWWAVTILRDLPEGRYNPYSSGMFWAMLTVAVRAWYFVIDGGDQAAVKEDCSPAVFYYTIHSSGGRVLSIPIHFDSLPISTGIHSGVVVLPSCWCLPSPTVLTRGYW